MPAIQVKLLGKRYKLGLTHARSVRELVNRSLRRFTHRRPEGRLVREFKHPDRMEDGQFWALRNVSFDIQPGEVVGFIGQNGAGKSTLLKLLSRITKPTEGRAVIHGRVASLLEVGTGFHPELTGRENVFLNGTILGMTKSEVARQFDSIVDFAGVETYIDTPVKRYSSGMVVRLGFAVAAHLQPEVLIVDEVLAVGDASFQKRCLGKMSEMGSEGRTILFVSHSISAIEQLTQRCFVLSDGECIHDGPTLEAVDLYLNRAKAAVSGDSFDVSSLPRVGWAGNREIEFKEVELLNERNGQLSDTDDLQFRLRLGVQEDVSAYRLGITFYSIRGEPVGNAFSGSLGPMFRSRLIDCFIGIRNPGLAPGEYTCSVAVTRGDISRTPIPMDVVENVIRFKVPASESSLTGLTSWNSGWGHVHLHINSVDCVDYS